MEAQLPFLQTRSAIRKSDGEEPKYFIMKKYTPLLSLFFMLVFYVGELKCQDAPGSIRGIISVKNTGEPLPYASVALYNQDSILVAGAVSDIDGKYIIDPIPPGTYRLEVAFVGYRSLVITEVLVQAKAPTRLDLELEENAEMLSEIVLPYDAPRSRSMRILSPVSQQSIQQMAVRDISSVAGQAAGATYGGQDSPGIRGSRSVGNTYYIDGVKVRGSVKLPQAALAQEEVIVNSIPATFSTPIAPVPADADPSREYQTETDFDLPGQKNDNRDLLSMQIPHFKTALGSWTVISEPAQSLEQSKAQAFEGEYYRSIPENDFYGTYYQPLSTFGADVDVASYANVRRMLNYGEWPHPDAVRIEEFINYFQYDYPEPEPDEPFSINLDQRPCDWNPQHKLLRIGLKTASVDFGDLAPSNLVFLIDVSGSMDMSDKLPLLQKAMKIMVKQLKPEDRVAIVVYASSTGLVLESTPARERKKIIQAIENLEAGGSTAGGAGIQLAYKVAAANFIKEGNNRVILATDGDFNVGVSSESGLIELIEEKRESGVFLSVLGFGTGNYQDGKMEQLADHGNGNYAYIDGLLEARKVLATELGANLHVVAKDTKFQIEFNPQKVSAYRLLGYENRLLATEDFDDDTKDAGDIGAGHSVTVLYEIIPRINAADSLWLDKPRLRYQDLALSEQAYGQEIALLKIRYKEPDSNQSQLKIYPVQDTYSTDPDFAFLSAVIQYGLLLRRSEYAGNSSLDAAIALAERHLGPDPNGYRREFVQLCKLARDLED